MTNPITPSIGRVVLFRLPYQEQDVPAIVTKVHSDTCVNLMVMYDGGQPAPVMSVSYSEDAQPATWHWMPYQLAVASGETQPTKHA